MDAKMLAYVIAGALCVVVLLVLLDFQYDRGYKKGREDGRFEGHIMSGVNRLAAEKLWHGTGEEGGFEGIQTEVEENDD